MTTPQRLAQYVQPNLHEARIAHQWAKISNASRRKRFVVPRLVPIMAVSLVLCGALAFGWHWVRVLGPAALNGTILESGPSGSQSMTLPDGSHIELSAASRLVIDEYGRERVRLSLKRGRANFEVAHQTQRRFSILASGFEISVIGTRFTVALGPDTGPHRVMVKVDQGKVSVRNSQSAPDERVLAAGQTWSAGESTEPSSVVSSNEPPTLDQPAKEPLEVPVPSEDSPAKVGNHASEASTQLAGAKAPSMGPKDLFEAAELARINGNLRESADNLNKLRKTYRSDPRAGLAAFELGRMRMDIFGDVSGSIDALNDAIRLSPTASFREDAEARLVQLYNRQGNLGACHRAKAAYQEHFPKGAAGNVVSRLCTP